MRPLAPTSKNVRTLSRTALSVMALVFSACGEPTGLDTEEFRSARERWASLGPASYTYTVLRSCFCPQEVTGPVVVTVQNGVVQSRVYAETGSSLLQEYQAFFPTVDGLFAQIDSLRKSKVGSLKATYDATYGYPTRIDVDVITNAVDDEFTYISSAFIKN